MQRAANFRLVFPPCHTIHPPIHPSSVTPVSIQNSRFRILSSHIPADYAVRPFYNASSRMAALSAPAAVTAKTCTTAPRCSGSQGGHASARPVASVRFVPFRAPNRRFYPRQGCSPGRVKVLFSQQGFPNQQQGPQGDGPQSQQSEGRAQQSEGGAQQGEQQWQAQGEGADQCAQQWQQQWQQARRARGSYGCRPGYADMLSPWFPADRSLEQMLSAANRMFGDMVVPWAAKGGRGQAQQWQGLMSLAMRRPWDVEEDDKAYTLRLDLPGFSKEDVGVKVDDSNVLFILAEKKVEKKVEKKAEVQEGEEGQEAQEGQEGDAVKARASRKFQTKLQLPQGIQREEVVAEMKDGVLTVTMPKTPPEETPENVFNIPIM